MLGGWLLHGRRRRRAGEQIRLARAIHPVGGAGSDHAERHKRADGPCDGTRELTGRALAGPGENRIARHHRGFNLFRRLIDERRRPWVEFGHLFPLAFPRPVQEH
jgi:hypothetical protein